MDTSSVKSVKLPAFDGTQEKFQIWCVRFKAFARVWKFSEALVKGGETHLPSSEDLDISAITDEDDRKKSMKAVERNSIAMAQLSMALTTDSGMALVFDAMTDDWPGGLAHVVMTSMEKKFQPADTLTRVELRTKLNGVSMSKSEDPATLFEQISTIQNMFRMSSGQIDEADLIAVVISAAPREYQSVLANEQIRLGSSVTIEALRKAMNMMWRSLGGTAKKSGSDKDGKEFIMSAFGGICFKCNQKGHKSYQCPKSKEDGASGGNGGAGKFKGKCNNCGKTGHKDSACWMKESNKSKRPQWLQEKMKNGEQANVNVDGGEDDASGEFILCNVDKKKMTFPKSQLLLNDPNIWIADTAATTHLTVHSAGMVNMKSASGKDNITVGNGDQVKAMNIGDISGMICDKHGEEKNTAVISDVTLLSNGAFNLFSVTKMIKNGWSITGNEQALVLKKDGKRLIFDIIVETEKGLLFCMYFKREGEVAGAMTDLSGKSKKMSVKEAHRKFGHSDEPSTRSTAAELNYELTRGTMKPCEACTVAKAKQKNIPKVSDAEKGTKEERRIYLDISTIKAKKNGPKVTKPNWRIMVDEHSTMKFSDFYSTKDGMVEPTCATLNKWKQDGHGAKFIRLDDAGENKLLQKRADGKDWKLNVKFEFTGRNTPQRNHLAELGFASLANKGRAMMVDANVPLETRYKLFREAFGTATKLDALVVVEIDGVKATRYKHFFGVNPDYAAHLRTWGEAGTVTVKSKFTPKVNDRGVQCMFIGYSDDHPGDVYRMWNPKTGGVHNSRDVIWLKRMFYQNEVTEDPIPDDWESNVESGESVPTDDVDNTDVVDDDSSEEESEEENEDNAARVSSSGRQINAPARLIQEIGAAASNFYEVTLTDAEQAYYNAMQEFGPGEIACVGAGLGGGFADTNELRVMKYKEAMETDDVEAWLKAVEEEHDRMVKHGVFKAILKEDLPKHAKVLTSTWAMKKKSNGTYRARLNARGFEQVDGEHFESHAISAPVTNDVTIRIVLVLLLMAAWTGELLDVKGAFLHGEFDEGQNLYMKVPEGFEKWYDPRLYLLFLLQTIYGLRQSAMAFWKILKMVFKAMKFDRSKADPCLYYQWTVYGLVLWISWIDDCFVVGPAQGVKEAKIALMERFDCDEVGNMDEYVGCKLERNWEERSIKITQPVLLQSFEDEFDMPDLKPRWTPAEGGQMLMTCDEENGVPAKEQKIFRKGTGKLLHMSRWSRPETLNSVRELSKGMKVASWNHAKAMYRAMQYCISTKNRGLVLKPNREWDGNKDFKFVIKGRSDANYATDPETRKSVTGFTVFLEGAPVVMKCVGQKSVTLSTAESELASATACAQSMLYVMRVLESIGLQVELPMELEIDNQGAVLLANNWSVGGRTRHVEVRQYFLRDLKDANIVHPKWIPGDKMSSDLFTKNLDRPLFEKHAKVYVGDDEYMKDYKPD